MTSRISAFVFIAIAVVQSAVGWEPKSPKDCRLAFLMGMTTMGDPGSSGVFPAASSPHRRLFDEIARLYAADIGASAEELATEKWREKVDAAINGIQSRSTSEFSMSLVASFGGDALREVDLPAAYLAGAYVSHGTTTGFRLVNQRKGLYIAWLTRLVFVDVTIDATMRPGIPGNITLTIRDGGQQTVQDVIEELESIRVALTRPK